MPTPATPAVALPPLKIVIIDDEHQILALLKTALEKQGFLVTAVSDPLRAMEAIIREMPRLVLSDLMMPKMDGHGVAQAIRQNPLTASIPVAFLSAAPPADNLPRAFRDGVVGYFEKPFHPARLGQQLRELIKDLSERKNELRGSLRKTSIQLIIEMMQRDQRSGVLQVRGSEDTARVVFQGGKMADVACAGLRGPDAIAALARFQEGDFVLEGANGAATDVVEVSEEDLEPVELVEVEALAVEPISETVLLVDDEPDILLVLKRAFEAHGYNVVTAENGKKALRVAADTRPDAIICDVMMPELDGWQIYHQIRSDFRINEARFVFLSAFPDLELKLRAIGVDADGYVAKGTLLSKLVGRIDALLQPRRMFQSLLREGVRSTTAAQVEPLGMKFILKALFDARFTGSLRAENVWHKLSCDFAHGQPSGIVDHGVVGTAGMASFLALCELSAGEVQLSPDPAGLPSTIEKPFTDLLRWAEQELTEAEQRVVDTNLVSAGELKIDVRGLDFFSQLAPSRYTPIVAMLREKKAPREIIAGIDLSPTEVEEVLRDLVRKHIIQFD